MLIHAKHIPAFEQHIGKQSYIDVICNIVEYRKQSIGDIVYIGSAFYVVVADFSVEYATDSNVIGISDVNLTASPIVGTTDLRRITSLGSPNTIRQISDADAILIFTEIGELNSTFSSTELNIRTIADLADNKNYVKIRRQNELNDLVSGFHNVITQLCKD
jgi:hypothetical protein